MNSRRERSGPGELTAAAHLRGLLDLARLVRSESGLSEVLAAVARVVSDTLGFATVVINLYRPETDEYEVTNVYGNERARAILLGEVSHADTWASMLDPRFLRHGAFFIPAGALEWDEDITRYTPELEATDVDEASAWHADDALFVTLDGAGGRRYGIISVDEPVSRRRPDDQLLDVLSAVAAHAGSAIESAHQFAQLQGALARHRAVIESSLDGVIAIDSRGRVVEFNPAAERTFGYRSEDAIGRELAELIIPPEDREAYRRSLARGFQQGDWRILDRRIELTGLRADGSKLPVELSLTLVEGSAETSPVVYGFIRDISERRRGEEQLAHMAYHDPLTGLPNRILIEQQLDLGLARARRTEVAVALMFVDLDDFKEVNDRLGHAAGDQLLAAVATRLRSALRDSDVLARHGGDEFLVLLSDLEDDPAPAAESVAAKLFEALREPFVVGGAELRTGASIGVSVYPDDASDTEALLRHADAAMYQAKAAGGGRLAFHRPAETILSRRASVSAQLRRAIADPELELHYQPVWRLRGERGIAGVEALLRWRHPDRGLLKPDSFINLAKHSAVGDDVIGWVLHEACRQAKEWQDAGLYPRLSVNIAPHQLLAPGLAARVADELRGHDLVPSRFMIELTESAWTVDSAETLAVLADLRAAGASLAIDEFGAGYSSLSRLHKLDFDVIKIDRGLLTEVPGDRTAVAVLLAMIDLARACDAAIVADGVENEEQAAFLSENGVDEAQGFLFGHPLQAHEITPLLARRLLAGSAAG
jgi:diguanylate cyclase (GGDEF)-like protein/PAS domain S-box-containing protein